MFEWFAGLNRWLKIGVALIFLGLAGGELFFFQQIRFWTWGVGIVLLAFAILGPSDD